MCHASFVSGLLKSTLLHALTRDVFGDEVVEAALMAPSIEGVVEVPRSNSPSTDLNLLSLLDEA